ncbi:MAG: stage II sporulation protein R [Peptococcaceae bacterium]|jgi:stage II sporulation protein R|nr:stage II sporulation protein R [Peptococcaceae bacterium]
MTGSDKRSPALRSGPEELVRLHVVANSNSAHDQAVKLAVRDEITRTLSGHLGRLTSAEQAEAWLGKRRKMIKRVAERRLAAEGVAYAVTVTMGRFPFPRRVYTGETGTLAVPAGVYRAVRVELGQARGRNWWCVLFPPLCLLGVSPAGAGAIMTGAPVHLELHLKVVDVVRRLLGA